MKLFLLGFCLFGVLLHSQSSNRRHSRLVLTNANVIDIRTGTIAAAMTVLIEDGRITHIAKLALVPQSRNVTLVNASGKFLLPGLWDMHVHSAFAEAPWDEKIIYPLYIANGITGIRDMGGNEDLLKQRRDAIREGHLLGPHMFIAGPFLAMGKADAQTIPVPDAEDAKRAVDFVKADGFDFVKILSNVPRDSYFAIAEEATKQKITFAGHVPYSISAQEAANAGQRSIEHLSGILLACSSREQEIRKSELEALAARNYAAFSKLGGGILASYEPEKANKLFFAFTQHSTWQVPTLVWTMANSHLDNPELLNDPRLKYVPASIRKAWDPAKLKTSPEETALARAEAERDLQLVNDMRRHGVQFLAGSDGPDPFVFPGFSLHDELELLVRSGFTPLQALQAATFNPALFIQKLDQYGTIEKDHVADLVLLDENPLLDIRNTRKISAVVLGGHYYPRTELDKMLHDAEDRAAKE
jgi:N-acetylglucosamine-6-phosphate deacetylase